MTVMFKSCRAPTRPVVEKPLINWRKIVFKSNPMNRERTMLRETQAAWASRTLEWGGECAAPMFEMPGYGKVSVRQVQYVLGRVGIETPHSHNVERGDACIARMRDMFKGVAA
jgi:hypothetical protein